jgi:hypothetical protein
MKRPLIVTVSVVLFVLVVAILAYLFQSIEGQSPRKERRSEGNTKDPNQPVASGNEEAIIYGEPKLPNPPPPWIPTAEELRQIQETEAVFYGKVIDQHGDPVPNTEISYTPTDNGKEGLYQTFSTRADEEGRFVIRQKNLPSFRVSVDVPSGYYGTDEQGGTFAFAETPASFPAALRKNLAPPHRADPANPVVFRLKKMGPTEPLVYWRQSRVLEQENEFRVGTDPAHRLLLKYWLDPVAKRSEPANNPLYDWGCEISVPGGGIAARPNSEAFDAPEDGYIGQVRFEYRGEMHAKIYKRSLNRQFFVRFHDGRFARIEVNLSAQPKRPFGTLVSWFNPSGSRSTEFNPSKQIELRVPR